ncbi:hypothetical protein FHR81_003738 [Actinoalloteichus hoggarensis]|nr:DUF998 domain-containing protein [Actinoalloteichus hoggarensis]MBB5922681.1 hypothetical protein [Actinoalloteichus hoggarensis]
MRDATVADTEHWPAPAVRAVAGLSLLGILLSAIAFTAMHVGFGDGFDAVSQTLSELVYVEGGASLIPISMVTLGLGSLVLLPLLRGSGALDGRLLPVLIGLWGVGLVLCAFFPADLPDAALTFSGWTHRISACVAFLSLAVAGLIMSERFRDHTLWRLVAGWTRVLGAVTLVQFIVFLLASMPVVTPRLWGAQLFADFLVRGFVERTMLGTQVAMLVLWIGRLIYLTQVRRSPAAFVSAGGDDHVEPALGLVVTSESATRARDLVGAVTPGTTAGAEPGAPPAEGRRIEQITLDRSTAGESLVAAGADDPQPAADRERV